MTQFLGLHDVVHLHDLRAPNSPLIDSSKLESALARPRQVDAYDEGASIHRLAAVLFEGVIAAHGFLDGNKRTAVLAVYALYALNGYDFGGADDRGLIDLAVAVAD